MKKQIIHILGVFICSHLIFLDCFAIDNFTKDQASEWIQQTEQLGFQENKGQMTGTDNLPVPYVLFKAEAPGLNIWVTITGLTYQFFTIDKKYLTNADGSPKLGHDGRQEKEKNIRWHRVDMVLKNASIKKENILKQGDITRGNVNYYLGHCPDGIFNVKTYTKIIIKEVYDGIDWILYTSKSGGLKHDFVVHPGANPNQVKLLYEGSGNMNVDNNQLQFKNELGKITEGNLLCYQGDKNNIITSFYRAIQNNIPSYLGAGNNHRKSESPNSKQAILNAKFFSYEINIDIANYDNTQDLIIDPQLVWGTLYGGNATDRTWAITTDNDGNFFMVGETGSTNFPIQDIGTFSQSTNRGMNDAFILKFDNNGNLIWATYYGGNGNDEANSIAIDNNGSLFIVGETSSTDFPIQNTGTSFQPTNLGGVDAFILRFDNNGNSVWATHYGGSGNDRANSIAIDNNGSLFIVGTTTSANFPTQNTGAFFQSMNRGVDDAFVLKFDNNGGLTWATYYGGLASDIGLSVAIDYLDNVIVLGTTASTDFPLLNTGNFFQGSFAGGVGLFPKDMFILKFDNNGNRLFATYYGGSGGEESLSIDRSVVTDNCGNYYVFFHTSSSNMSLLSAAGSCHYFDNTRNNTDGLMSIFDNNNNLIYASYLGNNGGQFSPIGTIFNDTLYLSFRSSALNSSLLMDIGDGAYFDNTLNGNEDTYILKFVPSALTTSQNQVNTTSCTSCNGSATVNITCGLPPYNYVWSNGNQTIDTTGTTNTITNLCGGDYNVIVTSNCKQKDTLYFTITGFYATTSDEVIDICQGDSIFLSGSFQTLAGVYNDTLFGGNFLGCDSIIQTTLTLNPKYITPSSISICTGDSIFLENSWRRTAGIYNDTLSTTNGCDSIVETTINLLNEPDVTVSPTDTTVCENATVMLTASLSGEQIDEGNITYLWTPTNSFNNNTISNPIANSVLDTKYSVLVTNQCGADTATTTVNVESCNIYIPNAITSNGDGNNDGFKIRGEGFKLISLIIYDRWGHKVFDGNASNDTWLPTQDNSGVYVYRYELERNDNGNLIEGKGNVTLVK